MICRVAADSPPSEPADSEDRRRSPPRQTWATSASGRSRTVQAATSSTR